MSSVSTACHVLLECSLEVISILGLMYLVSTARNYDIYLHEIYQNFPNYWNREKVLYWQNTFISIKETCIFYLPIIFEQILKMKEKKEEQFLKGFWRSQIFLEFSHPPFFGVCSTWKMHMLKKKVARLVVSNIRICLQSLKNSLSSAIVVFLFLMALYGNSVIDHEEIA